MSNDALSLFDDAGFFVNSISFGLVRQEHGDVGQDGVRAC